MMDGEMISNTSYQESGAGSLMSYAEREEGVSLQNRVGEEMSETEKEFFREKSEMYGFERHYVLSYVSEVDEERMGEATRDTLNEYFEDKETVDWCYSIHHDEHGPHAHVVLTGQKSDLSMYRNDLRDFNEVAKGEFRVRAEERSRERSHEWGRKKGHKESAREFVGRKTGLGTTYQRVGGEDPDPRAQRFRSASSSASASNTTQTTGGSEGG